MRYYLLFLMFLPLVAAAQKSIDITINGGVHFNSNIRLEGRKYFLYGGTILPINPAFDISVAKNKGSKSYGIGLYVAPITNDSRVNYTDINAQPIGTGRRKMTFGDPAIAPYLFYNLKRTLPRSDYRIGAHIGGCYLVGGNKSRMERVEYIESGYGVHFGVQAGGNWKIYKNLYASGEIRAKYFICRAEPSKDILNFQPYTFTTFDFPILAGFTYRILK